MKDERGEESRVFLLEGGGGPHVDFAFGGRGWPKPPFTWHMALVG